MIQINAPTFWLFVFVAALIVHVVWRLPKGLDFRNGLA